MQVEYAQQRNNLLSKEADEDRGPVAQWTTRLTTNQKIAGSSPARINRFYVARI